MVFNFHRDLRLPSLDRPMKATMRLGGRANLFPSDTSIIRFLQVRGGWLGRGLVAHVWVFELYRMLVVRGIISIEEVQKFSYRKFRCISYHSYHIQV